MILNHFPKQTFYPNQREALLEIEEALNKGAKYILLEMGTGGGKSVIMYTTSKMCGSAHICVMQKLLQKQYTKVLALLSVDGRGNSLCMYYKYQNQDIRCDSGRCITNNKFRCDFKPTLKSSVIVNDFIKGHYTDKLRPEVYKAFERFNLTSNATIDQLKDSFRKLVLIHHPDMGDDPEDFILDKSNFEVAENHLIHNPTQVAQIPVDKNYACTSNRGDLYWQSQIHCNYWQQKVNAINSPIVVHNYPYLISEANYVGDFGTKELLGCDEAHNLDKVISDFVKISINSDDIQRIGMKFSDLGKDITQWIPFLTSIKENAHKRLIDEKENFEIMKQFDSNSTKLEEKELLIFKLEELNDKCYQFLSDYNDNPQNWTIMLHYDRNIIDKVELKPTYIGKYANDLLFKLGNKVLMMSATILDPITFCNELGIPLGQVQYINVPSSYPPENAPIFPLNIGKINSGNINEKISDVVKAFEFVLELHSGHKGIVHCMSNNIRNLILNNVKKKYYNRLLVPTPQNKNIVLEKHKQSTNTVIMSTSFEEGLDLAEDLSRFQFFPVLPFNSLNDPRTAKKLEADKQKKEELKHSGQLFITRYDIDMLRRLIQASGRSIRSETDTADTFICPSTLGFFISNFTKFFEQQRYFPSSFAYFKNRIVWDNKYKDIIK